MKLKQRAMPYVKNVTIVLAFAAVCSVPASNNHINYGVLGETIMVQKEKTEDFRTAHTLDEAKTILLSQIDFTSRMAITMKKHYDRRKDEKPSSDLSAATAGVYYHAKDYITGKLPDFQKISRELTPVQIVQDFNPLNYLNETVLPPSVLPQVQKFLKEHSPFVVVVSDEYVNTVQAEDSTLAYQLKGTNIIVVRKSDYDKLQQNPDQKDNFYALIAHEITHLAALATRTAELPWWFNEAGAEYVTHIAIKNEIPQTDLPHYSQYVRLAYYLAELVGKDVFVETYFTGDLSKIRGRLDRIAGFGTFDKFMNDPHFSNKYGLLRELCEERGLKVEEFERDLKRWGKTRKYWER